MYDNYVITYVAVFHYRIVMVIAKKTVIISVELFHHQEALLPH